MQLSALLERPLLLLGGGREGLATLELLRARGHARSTGLLADQKPADLPADLVWVAPADLDDWLTQDPVVIRSPGFAPQHPLRVHLDARGTAQTTATRLTLGELRAAGVPVIGVTASKGKSTISTLIHRLLLAAGQHARLLGNIGIPALSQLDAILADPGPVVLELSSYQCDDLPEMEGPDQVVFGSLFPEHLDWHGSLAAYYGAKATLLAAAAPGARLHVDARSVATLSRLGLAAPLQRADVTIEWVNDPPGLHAAGEDFLDGDRILLRAATMGVPGRHNRENACLAYAAARCHGCTPDHLAAVLAEFGGLEFRLQDEGQRAGIHWINDSISTAPESARAGLEAMQGRTWTLIAGGQDRGYDYAPLARAVLDWQVREVITLPESGGAIAAALARLAAAGSGDGPMPRITAAGNLAEAVTVAAQVTAPGCVCLFSPAAPSYHAWPGFVARGRDFRTLIQSLS